MRRSWTSVAYSVGRVQIISSYLVLEAVMPHRENCASTCMNQTRGLAGQNGGNCVGTAAMLVGGLFVNMSVTLQFVSHTENLVDGVNLIQVTNCSFDTKNY